MFDFCFGGHSQQDHQAAIKIQSQFRLRQSKKKRVLQHHSAVVIQRHARGFLVRYDALLNKYGEDPISFKLLLPSVSVTTRCIHRFRIFSLNYWLHKENNSCPLCRTKNPLEQPLLNQ